MNGFRSIFPFRIRFTTGHNYRNHRGTPVNGNALNVELPIFVFSVKTLLSQRIVAYSFEVDSEEVEGNASDSVKTKAAWRYDVGQSGKHSLQSWHSLAAISGIKLISFLIPLSTNPSALALFTSAQYLTHRPQ